MLIGPIARHTLPSLPAILRPIVVGAAVIALLGIGSARAQTCPGDCDENRQVSIGELVTAVNIALGNTIIQACQAADRNGDGGVTVNELIAAVSAALNGCPVLVTTPTATATRTDAIPPTATVTASATASTTATRSASATATATRTPTVTATATPTATPTVPPSVEFDVVLGPDPAQPGGALIATIIATNSGQADLLDVEIEAIVPNQVDAFPPALTDGAQCVGGGNGLCERAERVIWTIPTLRAGEAARVAMPPRVTSGAGAPADGTSITVQAMLRAGGHPLASAAASVLVDADPVLLLELHGDADPVAPGALLTYTLTVTNRQLAIPAADAILRMPLPPGTEMFSASDGGELIDGAVQWSIGTLAPGERSVRELVVAVSDQFEDGQLLPAEAEVEDAAGERARATALAALRATRPLQLAMELSPESLRPGETAQVALTVTNAGLTPLLDVEAELILPDGIASFQVALVPGGSCPDAFGSSLCQPRERARWPIGTLAPGASVTLVTVPAAPADARAGTLLAFTALARDGGGHQTSTARTAVIQADPVLELALREDRDPVAQGETITYTLHFANRQLALPAMNAVLRLPVPPLTTLRAASDGGALVDGAVQWNLGTINPGEAGTRQLAVQVIADSLADGTLIEAEAELADAVAAHRVRANAVTRTRASSPLRLAMELGPEPLRPGETAQVALTLTNTGPTTLLGIEAELLLPEGLANFPVALVPDGRCPDALGSSLCQPRERVAWSIASLAPGAGVTVATVPTALADVRAGTLLTFNAFASHGGDDDEISTSRTVAIQADPVLELELREDGDPVAAGAPLTYTLHFANRQLAVPAMNTVLRLPLPPGTTLVDPGESATVADGVVSWTIGTLNPGEAGVRQLTVAVDAGLADGTLIAAEAELADAVAAQRVRANAVTRVRASTPLRLAMELAPEPLRPGEVAQVALTVTNTGPIALLDVEAEVILPDGLANFPVALVPDGSCPDAFGSSNCQPRERVVWPIGTLAPGAGVTVAILPTALADLRPGTLLTFNAFARHGGGDQIATSRSLAVQADPVLELELREDADPLAPGQFFTYTLAFGNRQVVTAAPNVVLRLPLPAGVDFQAASDGGVLSDGIVEWNIGTLNPGEAGVRQLTVALGAALADGTLIRAEAELADAVAAQSVRANAVTRVRTVSPLRVAMEFAPEPLRPGETTQLALTVTNVGAIALLDVEAEAILPDGVAPFPVALLADGSCPDAFGSSNCQPRERVVWPIGTLAPGAGVTVLTQPLADPNVRPGSLLTFNAFARAGGGQQVATSRSVTIQGDPRFELELREMVDPVPAGGVIAYQLSFANRRTVGAAQNVVLSMPLPPLTELVSASDGGVLADGVVTWTIGTLDAGAADRRELVVGVAPQLGDGFLIEAAAELTDGIAADRVRANAVTRLRAGEPLQLAMERSPGVLRPGEAEQVALTLTNTGPIPLLGVAAEVYLPEGIAAYPVALVPDGTCPDAFGSSNCQPRERAAWSIGTLAPGAGVTVATVPSAAGDARPGSLLTFNAFARHAGGGEVASGGTVAIQTDPQLELELREEADPVAPGGTIFYALAYGNHRTVGAAQNAVVRMPVPAGTTPVAIGAGGVLTDGVIEWSVGTLNPGDGGVIRLAVVVDDDLADGTIIDATAEIADAVPTDTVHATAVTRIKGVVLLAIAIETDDDVVARATPFQVRVRVGSASPIDLLGVTAATILPDGIANVTAASIANATCPDAFGSSNCQPRERVVGAIGTLQPAAESLITFPITVPITTPPGTILVFNGTVDDAGGNTANAAHVVIVGP